MSLASTNDNDGIVRLANRHGRGKRLVLAGFGAFAIVAATWEFHPVLTRPTLVTLPFLVILVGASAVGGAFLAGALWSDDVDLTVADGAVHLHLSNPLRRKTLRLRPEDIQTMSVHRTEWESGPDTFHVELRLAGGRRLTSSDYASQAAAQALLDRLHRALAEI